MEVTAAESSLAASIAEAARAGEPLAIWGHATKEKILRPVRALRHVSTRDLTGITLYSPKELVISARAATPLREIQRTLADSGQHLIAEPPDFSTLLGSSGEQTLGGVVATNLSGPRRVAWGAMRDHVLGIRAVNGAGEIIRSGGRVLKNVTGLDLCKLLTGSHGTLGVMTEITLKVLPAPETTGTLLRWGQTPEAAVASLSAALGSPYGVSGAAYLPADAARRIGWDAAATVIRIEDFAPSVAYRLDRLRAELGGGDLLDDAPSRTIWWQIGNATPLDADTGAVWRVSVRPSRGPAVLDAVQAAFGASCFLDWGGGLVWVAGPASAAAHAAVMAAALDAGGIWMLFRAPDALR
ncbi:MAG: FAD-binding protein, partial [Acetobacteraceae bacterium]|nr:FAD-binding protein [Acetobacteraceae bacterium]